MYLELSPKFLNIYVDENTKNSAGEKIKAPYSWDIKNLLFPCKESIFSCTVPDYTGYFEKKPDVEDFTI
jgi:hypothetical protein